jgi:hypothetical protein
MFDGIPELLNPDYLPPSFKFDQADVELLLEQHLLILSNTINLSLQLTENAVRISYTQGCGFCLCIG